MAKRQTRRSISIMGKTYRRLQARCIREGVSISGWLEQKIAPYIEGIEDPGPSSSYPTSRDDADEETATIEARRAAEFDGRHFSG